MTDFKVVFDIQAKGGDTAATAIAGVSKALESTDKAVKTASASMRTLDAGLEKSKQQWAQFASSGGQSISTLDSAVKRYRESWAAFGVTSSNVAKVFDSQSSSMRAMDSAGKSAYATLKQLEAQQKAMAKAAADATAQMAKLGTESSRAWAKGASGLSANGMAQLSSQAKQAAKDIDSASNSVSLLNTGIGKLGAVMAGAFAIDRIAAFGGEIVRTAAQMQSTQRGFEAVTGSSTAAAKEMDFVIATARRLGLELQGAAKSYLSLDAASKGTSLEGQKTKEVFVSVSRAMAALQRSGDDIEGALLAIGQMMSKGKVQAEELQGQLGERLPGAFNIAAQAMGVMTDEFSEMLQKGEVAAVDFLPKFAAALDNTYSNARFDGIQNNINRMSTEWTLLKNNIADTDIINNAINFITARLRSLNNAFAQSASSAAAWKEMIAGMSQAGNRMGLAQQLAEEQNKLNQLMQNQKSNPNGSVFAGQIEEQRKKVADLNQALLGLNQTQSKSGEVQVQAAAHTKKYAQAMGDADQAIAQASKDWKTYYTIAAQQLGLTGKEVDEYVAKMVRAKKVHEEASASTKSHSRALSDAAKEAKQYAKDQQKAVDAASDFIKSLKDELAAVKSYGDAAQFEAKLREATKNLSEKQAEAYTKNAIALKQQIEAAKLESDREKESITYTMRLSDEYEKQTAILAKLTEAKMAGASPEYLAQLKQELEALSQIPDSVEGSAREFAERTTIGLQRTNAAIGQLTEDARQKVSTLQDEMGQYMTQAARNMQSSLADFFFDPFAKQTESMGTKFVNMLRRMAAELAASSVLKFLTGGFSSTGEMGGLFSSIGGLFGFGTGSAMVGAGGVITQMPRVGEALMLPSGSMIINSGGGAVSSIPQYVNYAGSGAGVAGTANGWLGGPGWATTALGYAGAGLGGAGLGYMIGGWIGDKYNYGQAGGTIGGLAGGIGGYAAATSMGMTGATAGLASTGIGAIAAAVIAVIASQVKIGKPDAKLIANVTPGEGYDITTLESRHGGKQGIMALLSGIARALDPIGSAGAKPFTTAINKGAWAPGEKFLGDALKALFGPLGKLEESLGVMIPAFQFIGRIHNESAGIQIPGIYSGRMKFDDNAGQYMQQAVSIATMRLLQQPAVTGQMTDPITKAVVMLSGDLKAFQSNLEKVAEVRKYAGGSFEEVGGRKAMGKALDLSGGDIDAYVQNMKELGALRQFLGEWTPDVGAWTKTVAGFDAMEKAAIKFGVSVEKVYQQIDKTIEAKQISIQDKINGLLGKPQSIQSKLFAANQQFDAISAEQSGAVADLAQYNKDERRRALNAISIGGLKSVSKADTREVKDILKQLNDPALAGNPEALAQWQERWDEFWNKQIEDAKRIKNKKRSQKEVKAIEMLRDQMDPHAMEQTNIEAARAQFMDQQKKAILDQAQAYAGQGASQYAAKLKEINNFFSDAKDAAAALGISVDELTGYQKKATDALNANFTDALKQFAGEGVSGAAAALKAIDDQAKTFREDATALGRSIEDVDRAAEKAKQRLKDQFEDALKQFAGESVSGTAAALKAIDDQAKVLREDAIALGKSVEEVDRAAEKAKNKLRDDFVHGLEQMAGVLDANTIAFNSLRDQFKGLYEDAKTLGVGLNQVGDALVQSMKNLWEQMTSGITSARQSIAQQIAELQGPQSVATLAGQNVDAAKGKLADYYASGGKDVSREIALIQAVQSAVMARYQAEMALIQQVVQAEVQAIQTRAQSEIDAINESLNAQIEAENESLNARIEAINAATQAQVDAIQQAADAAAEARQEAQQAAMDALNEQLQTANQLKSAIKNIADYAKSLMAAAESPLSPEARLEAAKRQYEETLAKARAGDAEAAARYQQDAEAYRNAAKDYYASSAGYGEVYSRIQSDATALGNMPVTSPDSIENQMKELRKQQAEENKQAQKAIQDQIKAVQASGQDQIKAAQKASQDHIAALRKAADDQIQAIRSKADEQIKAAQDLDSRPDVKALKEESIKELQALDNNLLAAYESAQRQYQAFVESLGGVIGNNTAVLSALLGWLNQQTGQTSIADLPYDADHADGPPQHAAGGFYRGGVALVGEKGPELINFNRPGYVHTADETARILSDVRGRATSDHGGRPAHGTIDRIQQIIGSLPFDLHQMLSMLSAANDAHGAYANILDLPPTWPDAASAVQSLMLNPTAAPQSVDMPSVGYQPPTRPTVSRETAQLEDRISRIEAGPSGPELKGLKESLESIRRESKAGVAVQSTGFSQLIAVMNQMLARLEEIERRARYAS